MDDLHFDPKALSSLNGKISAGLASGKAVSIATPAARVKRKPRKGNRQGKQISSDHDEPLNVAGKSNSSSKTFVSSQRQNQTSGKTSWHPEKRAKRLRNGDFKASLPQAKSAAKKASEKKDRNWVDIAELGGQNGDLSLIDNLDSESEVEGGGKESITLGREVQDLAAQLGIADPTSSLAIENADESSLSESENMMDEDVKQDQDHRRNRMPKNTQHDYGSARKGHPSLKVGNDALIFDPLAEWYSIELPELPEARVDAKLSASTISALQTRGKDLLQKENDIYASRNRSSTSSHRFYSTVITSGTLTDRISALTLLVQESPLHNLQALENLVGLAKKRSRAQAIEVLTALKDLFGLGSLLPPARHLKAFSAQPGLSYLTTKSSKNYVASKPPPPPLTDSHLLLWTYEDWLKTQYFEVLQILERWCSDEISHSRSKALDMVFELIREKPEQEANLLRLLVNKLGDSEKKIASRASYNLLQLQNPHPMMKLNIIAAIESAVIFRPGQKLHAKLYAITTLNQTVLSNKEDDVVRKLLGIYFAVFVSLLNEESDRDGDGKLHTNRKGDPQGGGSLPGKMAKKKHAAASRKGASVEEATREKIISAILTGINRAIPYTDTNGEFFEKHLDTLFRITHSSNFNTSIQAMLLIQQLCGSHPAMLDRFYRTLYESLLDPRLLHSSKQVLYLNLLYRALKADVSVKRVQAFAKRLLQVITMHQPAFVCAAFYLLRELEGMFPGLAAFIDQAEEDADDEGHYNDDHSRHITYDGKKRAPEFSHADRSCLWELDPYLQHFHPSATLFATCLLNHEPMPSKPSLESHTLIQFLDRFVYRNPKKHPNKWHGASIMQPLAAADSRGQLLATGSATENKPLVNSTAFAKLRVEQVGADEVFFHKYFSKMGAAGKAKAKKARADEDNDSEASGEDEIWQALVESKPDIEGEGDEVDLEMDDSSDDADLMAAMNDLSSSDEYDSEEDDDGHHELKQMAESIAAKATAVEAEETADRKKLLQREGAKKRRKELRNLPTFASAEDYATMVENVDGEVLEP